ncbi:sacsin N-terminal ATP-binding-like domain-containing protein [Chryseobacterium sp. JK1]|uniref:sacsin N-terminal ATP-binding-like domain-containing protein n=1 Tax=Chryseobacterium sp. JK1 TaxID=874294 RepID=UPI003D687D67
MRDIVQKAIDERLNDLRNFKSLLSLNKTESDTNKGYNGRQILEMFQNCEDEGAAKVSIFLDTTNCILQISNDGEKAFSLEGYDSLLYPGLSSKVSSGYIGNKGLGFRSIINWADEIKIISNDFIISFKDENKKDILLNKLNYTEDELGKIREKRRLKPDVYPIPLLNCGKILDLDEPHLYTTSVIVRYKKEYENDITTQLENISMMTLLFLNNITEVETSIDGAVKNINVKREQNNSFTKIIHSDNEYFVIENDGLVDEDLLQENESIDAKRYSVKIAFSDDLSLKDKVLYNYFKTQIPFELPFVAHASLELDQNRNHSTESTINPFVLDKLFQLHLKLIEILKNKNKKSWLPYQSISNDNINLYEPYSHIIDEYKRDFVVYPTLIGTYLNLDEAKNIGNGIAKFLDTYQLENSFEEQIMFCDLETNPHQYIKGPDNYTEIIELIATNLTIQQRAEFINLLLQYYPNKKFSVLIDEEGTLIDKNNYVFTDKTGDNTSLKVPSYSKIRFLHSDLFQKLVNELDLQFETNKSRILKDRLAVISDVHSFEPQTVIKKIISETNDVLKSNHNFKIVLREFYQTVFHNYKMREDNPVLDYEAQIPCLNLLDEIVDIKSLTLSKDFIAGKISEKIFDELYDKSSILSGIETLGLENEDINEIENFLRWLGVNHISIVEMKTNNIDKRYINMINQKENIGVNKYELFDVKSLNNIVNQSNINNVIAWLACDKKILEIFNDFSSTKSYKEKIEYSYYGQKNINSFKNYIHYTIVQHFNVNNYLITNKKEEWFNPFKIDYDYLADINTTLDKNEVDRILSFLGAKKDFNDLDLSYLRSKTQELANRNNSKSAQVFYKNLVGHYRANEGKILDVDLYARVGSFIEVRKSTEIYFSDRIQLPEVLTNKFPILYYPSRSGGATAIELFGLKNLNDLDLDIVEVQYDDLIKKDFERYIISRIPFILAYRLDKITKEDVKRAQVQLLNKLKIKCCNKLIASVDGESFDIEMYSYIYQNDHYYLKIPNNTSVVQLKKNKQFTDTLSDIFLKVFDTLDEKKTFETILRQSMDDNIYDINNDLAEGMLEEAKILLGVVSIRLSIWKSIFRIKNIEAKSELTENTIEEHITNNFPQFKECQLFYSDTTLEEMRMIRNILIDLSITLEEYNQVADYKLNFDKLFKKEIQDHYNNLKKSLKNQLWVNLSIEHPDRQREFLNFLFIIEHLLDNVDLNAVSLSYNFNEIISSQLKQHLPLVSFELLDDGKFQDYDFIEKNTKEFFSDDELFLIRKDLELNSLIYFENNVELIKSKLVEKYNNNVANNNEYKLDLNIPAELIEDFEIEINSSNFSGSSDSPWLGGNNELSISGKKKLGLNAEEIVKKYLDSQPSAYAKVEHISKTSEGEHYDLKYYDLHSEKMKFVECKYFNGTSFYLSGEEKDFAENNIDQYEVWLVNKESKIFCIKNIADLGDLQPLTYRVNIKLKAYVITN